MNKFTDLQKHELATALDAYFKDKQAEAKSRGLEFSQNDMAKVLGRSASYITYIFARQFDKQNGSGHLILTDRIWSDVRNLVNFQDDVWDMPNYKIIMSNLLDAKRHHYQLIIDGFTGMGKTYTAGLFGKKYPKNTFYVKCYPDMTLKNFITDMAHVVGLPTHQVQGSIYDIRKNICDRLLTMADAVIIVDETEKTAQNAVLKVIDVLQSMHDYNDLFTQCSFVVMGANAFYERLKTIAQRKNPHSVPQFLSRFDVVFLHEYSKRVARNVCVNHYRIADHQVVDTLVNTSSDYRQLDRHIQKHLNNLRLKAA